MDQPNKRSILVADADTIFLENLRKDHKCAEFPIIVAKTGKEAQLQIGDRSIILAGIFVNRKLESPSWISVIRAAYFHRPATPLYLILDDGYAEELGRKDLVRLGIREAIRKPLTYKEMVTLIAPIALSFDAQAALEKARSNTDRLNEEVSHQDSEFVPILAEDFLSGTKSYFDVYIRLATGRYLKILHAGDSFSADRIESYLKKGLTHLHIKREIQQVYLDYCDHLSSALLKREDAPVDFVTSQVLNHGNEVLHYLGQSGVNEGNLQYATKFVSNITEIAKRLPPSENNVINGFMANISAYDHGVGTALLAGMLADTLEIKMDKPVQIVGMASFLHDIGLLQLPEELRHEDESRIPKDKIKDYRMHPMIGAEILGRVKGIAPAVVQAVEQHHMRLNGTGFPEQTAMTGRNRVAEIVGICCEFQRLIVRKEQDPMFNIPVDLQMKVFPGFSRQIVYAFRSAFYPRHVGE